MSRRSRGDAHGNTGITAERVRSGDGVDAQAAGARSERQGRVEAARQVVLARPSRAARVVDAGMDCDVAARAAHRSREGQRIQPGIDRRASEDVRRQRARRARGPRDGHGRGAGRDVVAQARRSRAVHVAARRGDPAAPESPDSPPRPAHGLSSTGECAAAVCVWADGG